MRRVRLSAYGASFLYNTYTYLHEPVGVVHVVFVNIAKRVDRLGQQVLTTLTHVEPDGREVLVFLGAEKQQQIGPAAPRVSHVPCSRLEGLWRRHDPDQHAHFFGQSSSFCVVIWTDRAKGK